MKRFPTGFLWGAATSSMQVEGGIDNNDWAEAVRQGKAPGIGLACDHYNRFEEDFDIAKSLSHNAHRLSVEWARIEPEEGMFDDKEIEHYRNVVRTLRARGMEPMVTIWHFSLPVWFVRRGAFRRKDAPAIFARYAGKVAEAFGEDVTLYLTINEPLVWAGEHGRILDAAPGMWPNPFAYLHSIQQLVRSHRRAYEAIKKVAPHSRVGVAKHQFATEARNPVGSIVAALFRWFWNRRFLNNIRGWQDFIGIQFYQKLFFWQSSAEDRAAKKSDIGWQINPSGLYGTLMEASRYGVPLYVTENGIADREDVWRTGFIKESLEAVHRAIEDGADVRGYLYWSLLDNYEFKEGFSMRFGLVRVDHEGDRTRTVRESAKVYAEIIRANALT